MFILVDGIAGSGKSYYGVNYIYENVDKYSMIYTNINGMKFTEKIKPLNFKKLLEILEDCNDIYHDELNKIDDETNTSTVDDAIHQYLINEKILPNDKKPILFAIDESHNYFDKKEDLLIWFITYHRHLFFDSVLFTQSYELIHFSYRKQFEYFIHAMQSSKVIGASFRFKYQKHMAVPYDVKNTKVQDIYLMKKQEVFSLYQSGDKIRSKSIIAKYLLYFGVFVLLALFLGYRTIDNLKNGDKKDDDFIAVTQTKIEPSPKQEIKKEVRVVYSNYKYIDLHCIKDICYSSTLINTKINLNDLKELLEVTQSKQLNTKNINGFEKSITILASEDFLNLFKGSDHGKISIIPSFK